jgi:hypothetical protein
LFLESRRRQRQRFSDVRVTLKERPLSPSRYR